MTRNETKSDFVRNNLIARIDKFGEQAAFTDKRKIAEELNAIRQIAHHHGFNPAVTVAHFFSSYLVRDDRQASMPGWVRLLNDAVASERQDVAACHAFAAVCSVRLAH